MESPLTAIHNSSPEAKWHARWLIDNPGWEERPVSIKTFINHPDYQDAGNECWQPIKEDLSELFRGYDNPHGDWYYNEAVFDEGIGGGKSYKASEIITYMVYLTLLKKNPQKFFHMAKGSAIYFMNMSIRGDQARKVVFGEIVQRVTNSPWFRRKGYLPNPNIKSELQFPKNITVVPGNSKETFPLGFNLLGAVMDEAAWYTETESHDVAEEMFNALFARIKNRFGFRGMLVMISSPRYVDDFIEKKMKEAETNKRIFTRRRASFESQPAERFSGKKIEIEGYTIPMEYETEARRNFERFKRDILAIPSLALEPYFRQWNLVEAGIDPNLKIPFSPDTNIFYNWFGGNPNYQYYMHIDLSLTTDATGIAMCHKQGELLIIDLMMRIKAPKGREIDLAEIKGIVFELKSRGFGIAKCTFDQFQSASSIQELNKQGLNSERLSVDKDLAAYETLKEGIYVGKIKYYQYEPFMEEMKRLEVIQGKKVDHPANSSKDICDAVAGAVYNCVINQNNFQFWFGGDILKHKTQKEALKEAETLAADTLVPYGFFRGGRRG